MNTFTWLLKREFWEHKGGFLWAPLVSGAIFLFLSVLAILAGESLRRAEEGETIQMNGVELSQLTKTLSPKELQELGGGLDLGTLMAGSWPFIVLTFVVFFYCLGALYDERKDRSILFWKSLPLSDGQTVLSKLASALVVAPVLTAGAAIATSIGFLILLSAYALYHGGNPIELIWGPASPLKVSLHVLTYLPVYAAWAMPTIGWLLLVSAWARTKPFLWALLVPVFSGVLVTWFDVMEMFGSSAEWFWQHVVGRVLLGTVPPVSMGYLAERSETLRNFNPDGPADVVALFSAHNVWGVFATPDLWIGVFAGAAMVFAAARLRRRRDEG